LSTRPPRRELALLALVLLAAVLLTLRPVLHAPATLALGSPDSEAPRHLWALWTTVLHMDRWGPFVAHLEAGFPGHYTRHLMDPINLLFFHPIYALAGGGATGAVLGFSAVHAAWTLLAGLGGWLLCRRLLGHHPAAGEAALLAALACATTPMLMASPWLGRSELLPGAAWGLHLWWLHRALQPTEHRRDRILSWDLLGAALSLGCIALGGWYLAGWLLVLEPPVALAMAWQAAGRDRRAWITQGLRLCLITALAVLPTLPALHALVTYPPPILGETQRLAAHMGINTPPWLLLPFTGAQGLPGVEVPAYPGWVILALGGWAAWRRPRIAAPWLVLGLGILLLSLGPHLVWSNTPPAEGAQPTRLPAWYLEAWVPPLRFVWGWCRIGILVSTPLAVAAAWGAADLLTRLRPLRLQLLVGLLALVAVEQARPRIPAGVRNSAYDPRPPEDLLTAVRDLPPGALLQLPLDDHYLVWQPSLERPIAESLELEPVRGSSYTVQRVLEMLGDPATQRRATSAGTTPRTLDGFSSQPGLTPCLQADAHALATAGFAAVVLHEDRLPEQADELRQLLEQGLGPPHLRTRSITLWHPRGTPAPPDLRCPLDPVELVVAGAP
jgi:hypothetical protein